MLGNPITKNRRFPVDNSGMREKGPGGVTVAVAVIGRAKELDVIVKP